MLSKPTPEQASATLIPVEATTWLAQPARHYDQVLVRRFAIDALKQPD